MQAIRVASSFNADAQMAPQYVQQVSNLLGWFLNGENFGFFRRFPLFLPSTVS